MALTRAQLLSGNDSQGIVLSGQVQAVTAGSGIQISGTGVLSINESDPTFNGFVRTNNGSAYNGYVWPGGATPFSAGQQLTVDATGNLSWRDADSIPWTQKGQLVVGTGPNTDTLLNVGADTAFAIADTNATSGLVYTSSATSAALLPVGDSSERPSTPLPGQTRYNNETNEFEGYNGAATAWQYFSSMPTGPQVPSGSVDKVFYQNGIVINEDYTTSVTANSMSAGPIALATGVTVTIPAGSSWVIT